MSKRNWAKIWDFRLIRPSSLNVPLIQLYHLNSYVIHWKKSCRIDNFCNYNSKKNLRSLRLVMPACVAIGTLVSMLSRQSLQHKTKACICHTRRRNNQRTFWVTFNPSRNKGSWEIFEILTHSHDKFNNDGGNNRHSIQTRAKPPRPPHIRVILSDWLCYCGVCFTKRHLKGFQVCFEPMTVHFQGLWRLTVKFQGHRRSILLGRYIFMGYN